MIDSLIGAGLLTVFFMLILFLAKANWVADLGEEISKRSKRK
jgi:hypothetical protein